MAATKKPVDTIPFNSFINVVIKHQHPNGTTGNLLVMAVSDGEGNVKADTFSTMDGCEKIVAYDYSNKLNHQADQKEQFEKLKAAWLVELNKKEPVTT